MGASGNRNAAVFAPDRWRQTLRNLLLCLPLSSSSSSFSHAVFWEGGGAEREAFFMLDQLLSSAIITFFE